MKNIYGNICYWGASQVALVVKNLPVNAGAAGDEGWSLDKEDTPGERNYNFCILALLIFIYRGSWLQHMRSQRIGHDWSNWVQCDWVISNFKRINFPYKHLLLFFSWLVNKTQVLLVKYIYLVSNDLKNNRRMEAIGEEPTYSIINLINRSIVYRRWSWWKECSERSHLATYITH